MKLEDYIKQAGATDYRDYKPVQDRMNQASNAADMHYAMGICTEAGEILDMYKKVFVYGQPVDVVNLKEELGDIMWYMARFCEKYDFTFEELAAKNISKLKARYGDKFSEYAALNRDLEKERKVLEDDNE